MYDNVCKQDEFDPAGADASCDDDGKPVELDPGAKATRNDACRESGSPSGPVPVVMNSWCWKQLSQRKPLSLTFLVYSGGWFRQPRSCQVTDQYAHPMCANVCKQG